VSKSCEYICDPKVCEACIATWINQNVILDIPSISVQVSTQTVPFHLPEQCNHAEYPAREDMRGRRRPLQAVVGVVSSAPLLILMDAHQHQPIGILILLCVLHNISVWHPWAHDAKRKQCLRDLNDGEYVRMGEVLGPPDFTAVGLV